MSDRDSTSELSEGSKHRRMADVDAFRRSKATKRSPPAREQNETVAMIKVLIEQNRQLMEEVKSLGADMAVYRKELEAVKQENSALKSSLQKANEKLERIDQDKRRKRLIVRGLQVRGGRETAKVEIEQFIQNNLGVQVELTQVEQLKSDMVLIKTRDMHSKIEILKNKGKLRSTHRAVFIQQDMTYNERVIQGKLFRRVREERERGNEARIYYRKIIVNGRVFKWDENIGDVIEAKKEDATRI